MKVSEAIQKLGLELKTDKGDLDREISGGYCSDLLSDVMGNSKEGALWITVQIHQNIVAVAAMRELSGIVLVNSRQPEKETIRKANQEGINIMVSDMRAFELAGKLYGMGIKGDQ